MKIEVTQADIDKGNEEKRFGNPPSLSCPVVQALCRITQDHWSAGREVAFLNDDRYALPLKAIDFIWDFDHDTPVQPFEFELDI